MSKKKQDYIKASKKTETAVKLFEQYIETEQIEFFEKAIQLLEEMYTEDLQLTWKYSVSDLDTDAAKVGYCAGFVKSGAALLELEEPEVIESIEQIDRGLEELK